MLSMLRPILTAIAVTMLPAHAGSIAASEVTAGRETTTDSDGRVQVRASGVFGGGSSFFGVAGGLNSGAIDDVNGQSPADESISFEFSEDAGLSGLDVTWTRAVVTLSGFAADPQGDKGNYNAGTGTWSAWQTWTGDGVVRFRFSNIQASAGRTITLTALDPSTPGCQVAVSAVHFRESGFVTPDAELLADADDLKQFMEHFGASMFWTIDPTESWPVDTKEMLALKLMSEAGGIGLSSLRFDFGGGDTGTGNQTSEPYTWRFPQRMKDGPTSSFDWSRRQGQQWFLRRARDMEIENLTLASLSAPHWMTKSGRTFCTNAIGTTNLDPAKTGDYADYLTDVMLHFRNHENINFDHISPVNEPEWDWESGSQEGDRATAADIAQMVTALHSRMESAGLDTTTKILVGEHAMVNPLLDDSYHLQYSGGNWNGGNNAAGYGKYREYLKDLFGNPALSGKIDPVAAYHSYFTDDIPTLQSNLRELAAQNAADRGVRLKQSEYSILGAYGSGRDLQFEPAQHVFRVIHKDLTAASASAWSWWLGLSPHDYKDGLVYTNFGQSSDTNPRLFDSKIMWTLGNFSRFIRPGYRRIGSGGHDDLNGLMSSSWLSPDGRETAIVAANFSSAPIVVALPERPTTATGHFLAWQRWVTDRGRNLRQETSVKSQTTLPPQSVTTFVGKLSQTPFRLCVSLASTSGGHLQVTARAAYENGVFVLPSIDSSSQWVFQPLDFEPGGNLLDGRYFIRRLADGMYLTIHGEDQVALEALRSPTHAWDVQTSGGGIRLSHPHTAKVLAQTATALVVRRAGAGVLSAQRVDPPATYSWSDNLGTGPAITLASGVDRWVQVQASSGSDTASTRIRLGGQNSTHVIGSMPLQILSRPGAAVTLRAAPAEAMRPFRFRIVPSDRDPVLTSTSTPSLSMNLPVGEDRELWELVEPGGGRKWLQPEAGRICWIRSVETGLFLRPLNGALSQGTPVVQTAGNGLESQWSIEAIDGSPFRVRHPLSGLSLNISGTTGLPILWADSMAGNSRFHLDPIDDDPLVLAWSHSLGEEAMQIVNPASTTTYTVNAVRGGKTVVASTQVIVRETFEEWSRRWHGSSSTPDASGDMDSDKRPDLLEYAFGTDPLVSDSMGFIQPASGSQLKLAWPKAREAIGVWQVEWSTDMIQWSTLANPHISIEESTQQIAATINHSATPLFVRLRFAGSPSV
jgi:O-glycosyl hydrolase